MKTQAAEYEERINQLVVASDIERKQVEDGHQTKLAGEYRRHQQLEDQMEKMQSKHLM